MEIMNVLRQRQMRTVFASTQAELSDEFLKNFEDVSAPLSRSQMEDIGKEAGVDLLVNDGKFSLFGDWSCMVIACGLLTDLLNSFYGIPPLSAPKEPPDDNEPESYPIIPDKTATDCSEKATLSDENVYKHPLKRIPNRQQGKTKVPDPIVLSVTSDDFTVIEDKEPKQVDNTASSIYDEETEQEDEDGSDDFADIDTDSNMPANQNVGTPVKNESTNAERKEYVHKKLQASLEKKQQTQKHIDIEKEQLKENQNNFTNINNKTKERSKSLSKTDSKKVTKSVQKPPKKNKRKGVPMKLSANNSDSESSEKKKSVKKVDDGKPVFEVSDISDDEDVDDESQEETECEEEEKDDNEWLPDTKFNDKSNSLIVKLERKTRGRGPAKTTAAKNSKKKKMVKSLPPEILEEIENATSSKAGYKCKSCDYVAKKKCHLGEHYRRNHRTKKWKCDECDRSFGISKDLKRHQLTHYEAQHCCDTCGKMYKSYRTFVKHRKVHEEDYTKPSFPCNQCDKVFSTKYVLTYHVKAEHMGIKKSYLCPTCGKSFTQKNSYIQHANVHMGLKPYTCEVCDKSFAYEKSLKEHRYTHEEIKRFKCEVCDKTFRQSSALAIHMKVHKGDKDHLCGVCGKGFTQKQALYRHERIHNGDKPFSCTFCGRRFSDTSIIRRHMILVHKKDPKQWREGVSSDLKGKEGYFIESYDGTISTGGRPVRDKETFELIPPPPKDKVFLPPPVDNLNDLKKPKDESFDQNKTTEMFENASDVDAKPTFFSMMVDRIINTPLPDGTLGTPANKHPGNTESVHAVSPTEPLDSSYIQTTPLPLQNTNQASMMTASNISSVHGLSPQDEHMASVTAEYLRKQALLQAVSTMHEQEQIQGHASHLSSVQHFPQDSNANPFDAVPHSNSYITGNGSSDAYKKEIHDVSNVSEHGYQDIQQQDPTQRPVYDKNTGQWSVSTLPYLYVHQNYNIQYQNQNQQ